MIIKNVISFSVIWSLILSQLSASSQKPSLGSQECYEGAQIEHMVSKASKIYQKTLENYSVELYHKSPFSDSLFRNAYAESFSEIEDNYEIILPMIIMRLAEIYSSIALKYNRSKKSIEPGSAKFQDRADMAKIVIVFVQESTANAGKFTDEQALIFLEFMYRFFGSDAVGERYGMALHNLYTSIELEKLSVFYDILVQYFDPNFIALPVFFIKVTNEYLIFLQHAFINFIESLYDKVIVLASVYEKESFNRHACMLISSMLSCSFYYSFTEMITELIHHVDIAQLGSSPRFAKATIELFKKPQGVVDANMLDVIVSRIIEDSAILSLKERNYIDIGSILDQVSLSHSSIYGKYFDSLSGEASERLIVVQQAFSDYNQTILKLNLFDSSVALFPSMNNDHLDEFIGRINSIIPVFPDYFIHNSQEAGGTLFRIVSAVPNLVTIAFENPSPELNVKRFILLVKIIELATATEHLIDLIPEAFSKVILLFNLQTSKTPDSELDGIHETIADIIKILVEKNQFFKIMSQRMTLHNYHKILVGDHADEMMSLVLMYNLEKRSNKAFVLAENISTIEKLKMETNSPIVSYIFQQLNQLLADYSSSGIIDNYRANQIRLMISMVVFNNIVTKTEHLFIEKILERIPSLP